MLLAPPQTSAARTAARLPASITPPTAHGQSTSHSVVRDLVRADHDHTEFVDQHARTRRVQVGDDHLRAVVGQRARESRTDRAEPLDCDHPVGEVRRATECRERTTHRLTHTQRRRRRQVACNGTRGAAFDLGDIIRTHAKVRPRHIATVERLDPVSEASDRRRPISTERGRLEHRFTATAGDLDRGQLQRHRPAEA